MTSQEGFEPPTDGLEGRCSIQLSYWDIKFKRILIYHMDKRSSSLILHISLI